MKYTIKTDGVLAEIEAESFDGAAESFAAGEGLRARTAAALIDECEAMGGWCWIEDETGEQMGEYLG